MRRLVAIALIWLGCAAAWLVLGSTLVVRSGEVSTSLEREVHALWGPPIDQGPPAGQLVDLAQPPPVADPDQAPAPAVVQAPLRQSKLDVALALTQRKKGLIWFPTYDVDFSGVYTFQNTAEGPRRLDVRFPLVRDNALYEGFEVSRNGEPVDVDVRDGEARFGDDLAAGEQRAYTIAYRSRGSSRWGYELTAQTGKVEGFDLTLRTDFADVNFPSGTVSPSEHARDGAGWRGRWQFKSLVASTPIGVELPQLINPGPLASRITFFAPVSLLFFFFVVAILAVAQKKELHPLHYFFLGCAFFAFHLLFSYLVDHVSVSIAFGLSAVVSVALTVSYARLFVGWKFAVREVGGAQLLYLVLFSFTFFWSGFTGLAVTIGAILTLFVVMQITGRKSWRELLSEPAETSRCASPYRCAHALGE
ncbi:MAG: inner membrane CreD family protein [Polyangiaceae bacterium]|nr:inner membrane CreD family protein [Polyangiaceae bacterium]